MEMHKDYDKMRKQLDRISWLLDQDAKANWFEWLVIIV
jgi:hypothetical protein